MAGIKLPNWINSEEFLVNILTLEGSELYNKFGFNDSTSCTKFLSRFIPDKPKNMKFSKHLKTVLGLDVDTEVEVEIDKPKWKPGLKTDC
jgi:hypothetical protein